MRRVTWVVLAAVLAVAAADNVANDGEQNAGQQGSAEPEQPSPSPLPAAALAIARALTIEKPLDKDGRSATQELQVGDATLIVRRRSKTPQNLASLPQPVYVTSSPMEIHGEAVSSGQLLRAGSRAGRKLTVGEDGVPTIHGVRVPDDEEDRRFTWRNARVIKGVLTPYDSRDARAIHAVQQQQAAPSSIFRQARAEVIRPTVLDQGATAVRAPILTYAHPELGVQTAVPVPPPQTIRSQRYQHMESLPTAQAVVYFARDNPQEIHNDHSPYSFEPAELQQRDKEEPALQRPTDKRYQQYELKLRPKKTPSYAMGYDDYYYSKQKRYQQQQPQQQYGQWGKEQRHYKYLQPAEYPDQGYNTFYTPDDSRPFWQRLGELIRSNVQTGVERMSDLARPVMEPIATASQVLSENFGLVGSRGAQEKVGVVGPLLGATSVLPAIGLVAGGAALGLGAAAVGRFLESAQSQVVQSKSRTRRSLLTGGRPIASFQDAGDEALDNMVHALAASEDSFLAKLQRHGHHSWSDDTPCAKRIFCDVMTQQPEDSIILMEKKMGTFLSLIHPGVARALSDHMSEVMDAVRRRDCAAFTCAAAEGSSSVRRGSSVVTGEAVVAPVGGHGPRR